jgi:hypothetical protein
MHTHTTRPAPQEGLNAKKAELAAVEARLAALNARLAEMQARLPPPPLPPSLPPLLCAVALSVLAPSVRLLLNAGAALPRPLHARPPARPPARPREQERKASLEAEAALCEKKLERASKLIGGLGVRFTPLHAPPPHTHTQNSNPYVMAAGSAVARSLGQARGRAKRPARRPALRRNRRRRRRRRRLPPQGEKSRWSEMTRRLAADYVNLTGDALLAAG